jgi:hypothetical protein
MEKPPFTAPCNHCGACCKAELCHAATHLFESAPCPALSAEGLCGLVVTEQLLGINMLHRSLGIGMGCSMPDADTTDEEIALFDERCMERLRADRQPPVNATDGS